MKKKIIEILSIYKDPADNLETEERGMAIFQHYFEDAASIIIELFKPTTEENGQPTRQATGQVN